MADITNLSNFLGDVADAIRSKKGTEDSIPAKDFDTEILAIESGVDTSDADATEENIESGKTAYVNGLKVTGTLADAGGSADVMVSADNITVGNQRGWDCVSTTYTNSGKKIHKDGWYVNQHMKFEDLAPALGVTADKIVSGNTILGVEGTATAGGTVTTEGVKLFETEEAMHADSNAEEGDLAVVYRSEIQNMTQTSELTAASFPDTVVLPSAVSSSTYGYLMGDSYSSEYRIHLTATSFSVMDYWEYEYICRYTSSDGITYTRNTSYESAYTFSEPVTFDSGTWTDNYGYFIQTGGNTFDGFFQYTQYGRTNLLQTILTSNLTFDTSAKTVTWNGEYGGPTFEYQPIAKLKTLIDEERPTSITTNDINRHYYFVVGEDDAPYICAIINAAGTGHNTTGGTGVHPYVDTSGAVIGTAYYNMSTTGMNLWAYKLNLEDGTYEDPVIYTPVGSDNKCYWTFKAKTINFQPNYEYNGHHDWYLTSLSMVYMGTGTSSTRYSTSFTGSLYPDGYAFAKTQLNLADVNELLPGKKAYGLNGVVNGDGSIYDNLSVDELNTRILNLENVENAMINVPNDYQSSIYALGKTRYIKVDSDNKYDDILLKYTYNIHQSATVRYASITAQKYDAINKLIVSIQKTDASAYHLVYENYDNELLYDLALPTDHTYEGYKLDFCDDYTIVIMGTTSAMNTAGTFYKKIMYVAKQPTTAGGTDYASGTIYSATNYTSSEPVNYSLTKLEVICYKNYVLYGNSAYKSSSVTSYAAIYNLNTKTNKLIYSGTNSGISTSTDYGYMLTEVGMNTFIGNDNVYVMASYGGYSSGKVKICRYNMSTSTLTSVCTITEQSYYTGWSPALQTFGSSMYSTQYTLLEEYLVNLSSASIGGQSNYRLLDADGNELEKYVAFNLTFTEIDGVEYVCTYKNTLCPVKSVTYNTTIDIVVDTDNIIDLNVVKPCIWFTNKAGNSLSWVNIIKPDTVFVKDNLYNVLYSYTTGGNIYDVTITIVPIIEATSLDYEYSIYTPKTNQHFVSISSQYFKKFNTTDYTGTISPTEYNTALETASEISGEEV